MQKVVHGTECTLPSLPIDIWQRIISFLSVLDLDNLSKVSKLHYKLVTGDSHFRRRYLPQAYDVLPSDSCLGGASWAKVYRRNVALRQPPSLHSLKSNHIWRICGSYRDSVVLCNDSTSTIMGLPGGWTVSMAEAFRFDITTMADSIMRHCLLLPNGKICVVYTTSETSSEEEVVKLATVCMSSGQIISNIRLNVMNSCLNTTYDCLRNGISPPKVAIVAGSQSEYLVFFETLRSNNFGTHIHVLRRSDGSLIHTWYLNQFEGFNALVRGESVTDENLVVGVVFPTSDLTYKVFPVEGGKEMHSFDLSEGESLIDIVRSYDGITFASRFSRGSVDIVISVLSSGKEWRETIGIARGTWTIPSSAFQLLANGSQILLRPEALEENNPINSHHMDGRVVYWRLDKITGQQYVNRIKGVRRVNGNEFDWARLVGDGNILFAVTKKLGFMSIFDLNYGNCIRTVKCGEELKDVCVIGNHFVLAIGSHGGIYVWHFDAYCITKPECVASLSQNFSFCVCPATSWFSKISSYEQNT